MRTYTIIIIVLLIIGGIVYAYTTNDRDDANNGEAVICTMDAKICPDGSYVGRTGPNCEFAACPAATSTPTTTPTTTTGTTSYNTVNASGTIDFEGNVM